MSEFKYDAFISYRHCEPDKTVAKAIHKGLECFRVPAAVKKLSGKKKINRVFRDQEELPIGSDLDDNISAALASSEYLIVICSPRAVESEWVQKEIDTFIELRDREHVLAVLVEGEPGESFPKALLVNDNGEAVEPLAADVRAENASMMKKLLKTEIMRLAAPILYCGYDDLRQRNRERKIKTALTASFAAMSFIAVLSIAFGLYYAHTAKVIQTHYNSKLENQSRYLAAESRSLLGEGDRRGAVLVAKEALPYKGNDRPYVEDAKLALEDALYIASRDDKLELDLQLKTEDVVSSIELSNDGLHVAAADESNNFYLFDSKNGSVIFSKKSESKIIKIGLTDDKVLVGLEDGLEAYDYSGNQVWSVDVPVEENGLFSFNELVEEGYDEETLKVTTVSDIIYDYVNQVTAINSSTKIRFVDINSGEILAEFASTDDRYFTSDAAYRISGDVWAFGRDLPYGSDEGKAKTGSVTVVNIKTKELKDIETPQNLILAVFPANNDCLLVECVDEDLLFDFDSDDRVVESTILCIDLNDEQVKWTDKDEFIRVGLDGASSILKCRTYTDEAGETHNEAILSIDSHITSWNIDTGERICRLDLHSGIFGNLLSTTAGLGYQACSDGKIYINDLTTGQEYDYASIETGKVIRDIKSKSGVVAIRSYMNPYVTLLRYHTGAAYNPETEEFREMSLDELLKLADQEFGDVPLTAEERLSFNVD